MDIRLKIDELLKNPYFSSALSLILAVYAGLAAPKLPPQVIDFFSTFIGKIIFLFIIAYVGSRNPQVAIMIAIAFVVTLNILNERKIAEGFYENVEYYENIVANQEQPVIQQEHPNPIIPQEHIQSEKEHVKNY